MQTAFGKLTEPTRDRPAFDCYLPRRVIGEKRVYRRGRQVIEGGKPVMADDIEILFPGYFFVTFEAAIGGWGDICRTEGVLRLISRRTPYGWVPTKLPSGEVEKLIARGRPSDGVIDERAPLTVAYTKGQEGRITAGMMESFDAVFEMQIAADRIAVLVNMLGRKVPIEMDPADFRPL